MPSETNELQPQTVRDELTFDVPNEQQALQSEFDELFTPSESDEFQLQFEHDEMLDSFTSPRRQLRRHLHNLRPARRLLLGRFALLRPQLRLQ